MLPPTCSLRNTRAEASGVLAEAGSKKHSLPSVERCPTPQRKKIARLATSRVANDAESHENLQRPRCLELFSPVATPLPLPLPAVLRDLETIVINLDRRPDRMDGCAARLQAYCPWLRFKKFSACDGRQTVFSEAEVSTSWCTARNVKFQIQRSIRKGWNDVDSYEVRELALSAGERGCSVSHIRAWRHCVEQAGSEQKPLLVLEDDAAPTPEFTSTLIRALATTPKDADVLYLGYSQAAAWRREVSPDLAEAEYVWTTVGYIIWPKAAKYLLSQLPVDQPVDNWMATACADGFIKAYCVRPKIILQAEAWNVNSDVGHSDEHYWGPDTDIPHSDALDTSNSSTAMVESTDVSAAAFNADAEATRASVDARFLNGGSLVWDLDSEDSEDDR